MSVAPQLLDSAFFDGMSVEEADTLAQFASAETHEPGDVFFERGRPAAGFWLILEGRVALDLPTATKSHVIQTLGSGDVLGISWLVRPHTWQFTARAVTETRSIRFDTDRIKEEAGQDVELHDDLVTRFLGVMAKRLQATRVQLLDLYPAGDA